MRTTRIACMALFCLLPVSAADTTITARQVIERIQRHVGIPWEGQTVDTFKAGNPDERVTGIATTMMATFDVLQRAAASGKNLIITHEPTFYGHQDQTAELEKAQDAVYRTKQDFIREHHLVIWRFHDYWHRRRPDGIMTGMVRALGWEKYQNAEHPGLFVIPETSLNDLALSVQQRLDIRTLRVVGNAKMRVTKVALNPGAPGIAAELTALERDDVEVLLMGENPEWEAIEYGDDAAAEGKHKALIILGHIPSEQAGMEDCAEWLKGFVPEVPVAFVPAKEPFWRPAH